MGKRPLAERAFDVLVRTSTALLNYLADLFCLTVTVGVVLFLLILFPEALAQDFAEKSPAPPAAPTR